MRILALIFILTFTLITSRIILKEPEPYRSEEPVVMQTQAEKFSDIVKWAEQEYNIDNPIVEMCCVNGQYPDYTTDIQISYRLKDTNSGNKRYPYKNYHIEYNYTKNMINEIYIDYTDRTPADGIDIDISIEDVLRKYPAEMEMFYYDIDFSKRMSVSKIANSWKYNFYDPYDEQITLYYPPE